MNNRTNAELIAFVRETETRLGISHLSGVSRMRKSELVDSLRILVILSETNAYAEQARREAATVGEPRVYQGAMHEDPVLQAQEAAAVSYDWEAEREDADLDQFNAWRNTPLADLPGEMPEDYVHPENATHLAAAATRLGNNLEKISEATRKAAQALVPVAYGRMIATVQSMGRTVRGKVAAVELRTPDKDGNGRVLLVVQHDGHPHRRTLHRLVDVKLEPVAS